MPVLNKSWYSSEKGYWETPIWLFEILDSFYHFDCDVAASKSNTLCKKYFSLENSCLDNVWYQMNFMNPPYGSEIKSFIIKAHEEYFLRNNITIALLPARTDTRWFHNYIYNKTEILFIKNRLKYKIDGKGDKDAPFPSMVVGWGAKKQDFIDLERLINK